MAWRGVGVGVGAAWRGVAWAWHGRGAAWCTMPCCGDKPPRGRLAAKREARCEVTCPLSRDLLAGGQRNLLTGSHLSPVNIFDRHSVELVRVLM